MATVTIRMEDEEKKRLDKALENIGMNISTFYSIYTKKFLAGMRIPFDISVNEDFDPFYSEENQSELRRRIQDIEAGRNISEHELIEVE